MAVIFRELAGSPEERYTLEGFTARRTFLIPWEERHAFAAEILGDAAVHGGQPWVRYPGREGVFAVSIAFSPADPESLLSDEAAGTDLLKDLASYAGSFARAVVEYRSVPPQDRSDGPVAPNETQLSYRMEHGFLERPLLASGFVAEDDPQTPLPPELPLSHVVPYTDHWLIWRQVVGPPWQAIRDLQGTVNNDTFLGAAAGTLLFLGADADKLFRGSFDEGASPFCWELRYHFREMAIKHGGEVFGWNHLHRTQPPGFVLIQDASGPLYDSGDFSRLFRPEFA